jgi:hypothetical protein
MFSPPGTAILEEEDFAVQERQLLLFFLIGRVLLLWGQFGAAMGFDIGAHQEMLGRVSWGIPDAPVREVFYSYHPPLGFLIPRSIELLGVPAALSIQLTSFLASLFLFFILRATLLALGFLHRPIGIAFLYLAGSIPLQVFLAHSHNLDVLVLLFASVVLYTSVRVLWPAGGKRSILDTVLLQVTMVGALSFAMLTKFSGLLLFSLPPLCALLARGWKAKVRGMLRAVALCAVALVLVSPYYSMRYYAVEGTFFPNNGDWMVGEALLNARKMRDEDPGKFLRELFIIPVGHWAGGLIHRDLDFIRLSDTWRDFWLMPDYLGPNSPLQKRLGSFYYWMVPYFLVVGSSVLWIFSRQSGVVLQRTKWRNVFLAEFERVFHWLTRPSSLPLSTWKRFGALLALFALVQLCALIFYLYQNPFAGWGPAKGMYVAPVSWLIAYLLAPLFCMPALAPRCFGERRIAWQRTSLIMLGAIVLLHHALPQY